MTLIVFHSIKNNTFKQIHMKKIIITAAIILAGSFPLMANITLQGLFTDNMVLQRDQPIRVFGFGDDGEHVVVDLDGKTAECVVKDGYWLAELPAMKAGGPFILKIKGNHQSFTLKNVVIGDVWVCGGQSNMGATLWTLMTAADGKYKKEFKDVASYRNANIRMFRTNEKVTDTLQEDINTKGGWGPSFGAKWLECTPQNLLYFSAIGYFFGKALQPEVNVPIGLLSNCVGGTPAESYMSLDELNKLPEAKPYIEYFDQALKEYPQAIKKYDQEMKAWNECNKQGLKGDALGKQPEKPWGPDCVYRPAVLYNTMVYPLRNFSIKGVIWYQGETNAKRANEYTKLFSSLIQNWRDTWKQGDFPFYYVQLAAFQDDLFAWCREAQDPVRKIVKNTGMVTSADWGVSDDVHPPYKKVVGQRLAALALHQTYGRKEVPCFSPEMANVRFDDRKVIVTFEHVGAGLKAIDRVLNEYGPKQYHLSADKVGGFVLCGADQKFYPAEARIVSTNEIELTSEQVLAPTAVRYAFAGFPLVNLYNDYGWPALPFKTDAAKSPITRWAP